MNNTLTAPRRARTQRALVTTTEVWSTSVAAPAALHQFYLTRLAELRGPSPAQLRRARHEATIKALIARCTPNVCLALPLMGRPLVPTAVVRYQ